MAKLTKKKFPKQARPYGASHPFEGYDVDGRDSETLKKRKASRKAMKRAAFAKQVAAEVIAALGLAGDKVEKELRPIVKQFKKAMTKR